MTDDEFKKKQAELHEKYNQLSLELVGVELHRKELIKAIDVVIDEARRLMRDNMAGKKP